MADLTTRAFDKDINNETLNQWDLVEVDAPDHSNLHGQFGRVVAIGSGLPEVKFMIRGKPRYRNLPGWFLRKERNDIQLHL